MLRRGLCAGLLLLGACARDSGSSREKIEHIGEIQKHPPSRADMTYATLVERATTISDEVIATQIDAIVKDAELDAVAATADPNVSAGASVGRTVQQRSGLHLNEAVEWNFIDYYKRLKIDALQDRIDTAHRLQSQLTRKQATLLVTRLYFDHALSRMKYATTASRSRLNERELAVLRLIRAPSPEQSEAIAKAREESTLLATELGRARADIDISRQELLGLCHLDQETRIALQAPSPPNGVADEDFQKYLNAAIASSEAIYGASLSVEVSRQIAQLQEFSRWTNFHFGANFVDLLTSPTAALNAPVSWFFEVLDQGRFNRTMIRAEVNVALARLDLSKKTKDTLRLAADAWTSVRTAEAAFRQQKARADALQIDRWQAERQLARRQIDNAAYHQKELALDEARLKLNMHLFDLIVANIAYAQFKGVDWRPRMT